MLEWLGVAAGTAFTAVGAFVDLRRREGARVARARVPLLAWVTAATAGALAIIAATSPADWWNYLVIPTSTLEWFALLAWAARRREEGGVRIPFRKSPNRLMLLVLAGVAVLGGFMDMKTGGVSIANLLLLVVGASNVAVFLAVERSRPGFSASGLLLYDRSVPWSEIIRWTLIDGDRPFIEVKVRSRTGLPEAPVRFELTPEALPQVTQLLRHRLAGLERE